MTYRVCRHCTTSTFRVDGYICKVFLEPMCELRPGYYMWNVGFGVGKSRRQINDWYWKRKNKRARSLQKQITGRSGMKAIRRGFEQVLRLRWNIQPGDGLVLDCTSGDPERQFHAWSRWHRHHPEWVIDEGKKEFLWYRPPYMDDPIREFFDVKPIVPSDPLANTASDRYSDCFLVRPKGSGTYQSMAEIIDQLNQAPCNPLDHEVHLSELGDLAGQLNELNHRA